MGRRARESGPASAILIIQDIISTRLALESGRDGRVGGRNQPNLVKLALVVNIEVRAGRVADRLW